MSGKRLFNQAEKLGGMVLLGLLLTGCVVVLLPFFSALLWAAILCYCTWPLFQLLERRFPGHRHLNALLMTLLLGAVLVLPFTVVAMTLAENLAGIIAWGQAAVRNGLPQPPAWVAALPLAGPQLDASWHSWANDGARLEALVRSTATPLRTWIMHRGLAFGTGVFYMILSVFVSFFFFCDGDRVVGKVADGAKRLLGDRTQHLLTVVGQTVKGVVYGILGTALAQGIVAGIGFWIAGVPSPLLWGLLTFFVSFIPGGPPFVWVPATIWLFYTGQTGWGVFLAIWGFFVISGVDNVVRPYLISRGCNLPFILVLLGVLGGVLAFGFIGMFLGPVLLAMGYALIEEWTVHPAPSGRENPEP